MGGILCQRRAVQMSGLNLFTGVVFDDNVGNYRMPFAKIVTERLGLRQLVASDAEKIFEYRSRAEVSRYQSWGVESPAAIQSQIENLSATNPGIPGLWYRIGYRSQFSGEMIGDCSVHVLENEVRQAEFGISLVLELQCRAYATEVLRALLNYLFVELNKHRVFGSVDPRNLRSIRLMQRVGMRKEAHFKETCGLKVSRSMT
jgi:RimJ/RimL family protein N-acetyltransferase